VRAAVVSAPGVVAVEDVPDPSPADDEAVIAVSLCGICGTDLHVLDGDYPAVSYPVIPGHEFSGTVVGIGSNVTHLRPGAQVAVDPMIFCGSCVQCRRGATNLCLRGGGLGTTADGALAELVVVKAAQCEVVPPDVPDGWAPMIEPLSCVVHAMDRIGPVLGERTLVIGSGAAGLLMVGTLALAGARVAVLERNPERRALAPAFGAVATAGDLGELDDGSGGWDLVVDASGSAGAIALGLANLRRGARLCIFGVASPQARVEISPFDVFSRELTIIGTTSVRNSFRRAADLMALGELPLDLLVGDPLPLERTADAMERTRRSQGIKTRIALGATEGALGSRVA
jgi:2-desacetyl-2-hydroxyethyl bacteriochlorophyllide A dehydrogenase